MMDQTFILRDGRKLGFISIGDGLPLFFFHGTPGSRLALDQQDALAKIPNVRLILTDRPGYGLSHPKPGRTLLNWADYIAELADHLGLQRFAVSGESGGCPHALACAYALPNRVSCVLALSSPSPATFKDATKGMSLGNRLGLFLSSAMPWLLKYMTKAYANMILKDPESYLNALAKQVDESDRLLLEQEPFRKAVVRDMTEAYKQGGEAHYQDARLALTNKNWGFNLEDIQPQVYLWHGENDQLAPIAMARHLEQSIPNCKARYLPDAGHFLTENPTVIKEITSLFQNTQP